MKIRIVIVEDEAPARMLLLNFLKDIPDIEIVGVFENGFDGLKGVHELKPDLLLLDIQMPKLNGFEMLELLDFMPFVIFTTAYDQYAVKAFEQNAVDYLLKPFTKQRLEEALAKYQNRNLGKKDNRPLNRLPEVVMPTGEFLQRIAVRNGSRIKLIYIDDILFLEAQDDYVMIHTGTGEKHLKQRTMKYFEKHLPLDRFVRVHRSFIVPVGAIEQIELYQKDSYIIKLRTGQTIPVSKSGYTRLKDVLGI
jgi:two-component system LytT family response regulator